MDNTLTIIGTGNLGLSIIRGLAKTSYLNKNKLIATYRNKNTLAGLEHPSIKKTTDNAAATAAADIIILCVQPKQLDGLLEEIHNSLNKQKHLIISLLTAVTIKDLESKIGTGFTIARAMPNTAISVLESMTCLSFNKQATAKVDIVTSIFGHLGKTLIIGDELMQAATVVGASGIAFWLRFIRATTQGGIQLGFDSEDARKIAIQTCLGAASLLAKNGNHPEKEIDRVTTPQGCTIAGLNEMEHHGMSSALIKGIVESYNRITKMKTP